MYFRYFDTFSYELNSRDFDFSNIFKRLAFSAKTMNNKKIMSDYYVIEGDTLENIAKEFYGDEKLSWLILLTNSMISKYEFPQSLDKIESLAKSKYPGSAFSFDEYMPEIRSGDILIKCTVSGNEITSYDADKYAIVQEYNNIFRHALVRENIGLAEGDFVSIKRLDSNSSIVDVKINVVLSAVSVPTIRNFVQLKRIEKAIDSPVEFLNANSNYISPYYINDTYEAASNALGVYSAAVSDSNTIYNTILYSYIRNISTPSMKTILQEYIEDNNKNRIIKVLKPKYVNVVMAAIQELLTNSEIRTKTIDIEG